MGKKKKKKNIYICEYCGNEHDGSYGSGRFCNASCTKQYSNQFVTDKGRENQIATLVNPINKKKSKEIYNKNYQEKLKNDEIKSYEDRIPKSQDSDKHNTPRNGKLGELETIKRFIKRGIPVYIPINDNGIDMLAEFNGKYQKIQVKSSTVSNSQLAQFYLTRSKNKIANGPLTKPKQRYTTDEVDYFSLYDIPNDKLFLLKNDGIKAGIYMRYSKAISGQEANINHAEDYDFDKVLDEIELGIDPDDIIDADYEVLDEEDIEDKTD